MARLLYLFLIALFLIGCEKELVEPNKDIIQQYFDRGNNGYQKNDIANSFKNLDTLLSISNNSNVIFSDSITQINHLMALCYVGNIYERLGNRDKALESYNSCIETAKLYNIEMYEITSLANLAGMAVDDNDAINIIINGLQQYEVTSENEYSINQLKQCLALLNAKQGNYEVAKSSVKTMINAPIYKNKTENQDRSYLHRLMGEIYSIEEKYDSALVFYNEAIRLNDGFEIQHNEVYLLIAENFLDQKKYKSADSILTIVSMKMSDKDLIQQKRFYELYLELSESNGNTEKGLNALSKLRELDNVFNDENNKIQGYISDKLENENLKSTNKLIEARFKYISGIGILCLLLFTLFHFYKQSRNKNKILDLELTTQKLETRATNRYIDGQEEQNKRFAEILHDNVGANLSALNMFLSTLKNDVSEKKYNHLSKVLGQTINETRYISHLLDPPALKSEGLIGAVAEKAEDFCTDNFIIEVNNTEEYVALEEFVGRSLYNAILEFMNNAMKYAEATKLQIDFTLNADNVLAIKIADNGKGFDTNNISQSKGLGLNSIKSRINYFGGSFDIQSSNKGTTINLKVPAKAPLKQSG